MWKNLPLFPERASALAWQVDGLYFLLIAVSAFFTLLIFALIFVFAVKYRRSAHPHAVQIEGSLPLELAWTLIPLGICMIFFAWGSLIYFQEARPPKGAMEVYAVAKQWMWKFEYEGGQRDINQLHLPVNRDVKMIMSSQDAIHSFFVPAFRIKADVLPGRFTTTWFRPTKVGTYHLFCSQYCGTDHSGMIGQVIVMEPAAYQAWMSGGASSGTLASNGQQLFQQLGCATCHRFDTQGRAPNLTGVFGKPVLLEDGRTVIADENYIRESILIPGAKIVSGFKPIMPTFQGQVSEENLMALVAYVKSLAQAQQKGAASDNSSVPDTPNSQ
ncbi:MAG TPA: cytochrome c oxidase subunit II [Candidatus Limnocylindrales bacterium]|nr:cytochrome c oxidase subunit II [Candidatus Limnocylindrales bacterium]